APYHPFLGLKILIHFLAFSACSTSCLILSASGYRSRPKRKSETRLLLPRTPAAPWARLPLAATARSSFCLRFGIEFDIRAMEPGRSFVAIKHNADACTAGKRGQGDDTGVNFNLWAARGAQFAQSHSISQLKLDRGPGAERCADKINQFAVQFQPNQSFVCCRLYVANSF